MHQSALPCDLFLGSSVTYNDLDLIGNISDGGISLVNYSYLADGTKLSTLGKRTSAPKKSITLELPKLIVPYKVLKTTSHEKDFAHNLHD